MAALVTGARLIAPELLDAEVTSALRSYVLGGRLTNERATTLLDILAGWPVERISHRTFTRAAWSFRHNLSAYDAFYAAIATAHAATLLTAAGRLARTLGLGIPVRDIRDE